MLIILSGPSCSGKNTIMTELQKEYSNLFIFKSQTTRSPRESDIGNPNCTYNFISKDEFLKLAQSGAFLEYEEVHGNYYGILKNSIHNVVIAKDKHFIRDIDVKGHRSLRTKLKEMDGKIFSIYLLVPKRELEMRLKARGDAEEDIKRRLMRKAEEDAFAKEYDIAIKNIDLDKTLNIIKTELNKRLK